MITEEMLAQAAAELAEAINASLPAPEECRHQFSAKFARRMKRLIYRINHPYSHTTAVFSPADETAGRERVSNADF